MINIAICDDSIEYINTIEDYFCQLNIPKLEYDVFMSGEELLYAYKHNNADYDAIFLDMEMGELNGIETANYIRQTDKQVVIVFITSYRKYMQKSFECMPFRFLLKPIKYSDFEKVCNEISVKLKNTPETFIFLENKKRTRIYCSEIIFFESSSHWILIYTCDGKIHKIRKTMIELFNTLGNSTFVRTHRAFAININHIYQISENSVIMHHYSKPIPLSKTYKKKLINEFINHKERKYVL